MKDGHGFSSIPFCDQHIEQNSLEMNFMFLLKNDLKPLEGGQGKAAFSILVVASEIGNWLALQDPWAMPLMSIFTDKATKTHRQSHPRGKRWGRIPPGSQVRCSSHHTIIEGLLGSGRRTLWAEGISQQVVIRVEKKGAGGD